MAPKTVLKKPAQNKGSRKVSGPTAKKPAAAAAAAASARVSPSGLERQMLHEVAIVVANPHDSCDVTARGLPWLTNKSIYPIRNLMITSFFVHLGLRNGKKDIIPKLQG